MVNNLCAIFRQKEEKEAFARQAQFELQRQREMFSEEKKKSSQQTEEKRKEILAKMREIETRQAKERLQVLGPISLKILS